jgi:hypothetical protein
MSYIHCDNCEREAPPFDECKEKGWFMSPQKSVSGIPMDMLCPACVAKIFTN